MDAYTAVNYRAEIDGLRAVALIPVILFHAGFTLFSGGFVGVDVFFVISGYLITSIIIEDIDQSRFNLIDFYERRARRILPALFFVLLVCIPFAYMWLPPKEMKEFAESIFAATTFWSNIFFWQTSGYFATAAELKPLLHTWSLAIEEQFYILFPLLLMLIWGFGKRAVFVILSVFFLTSLGLSQWGAYSMPTANFYLLPTRGWELLVGSFAALYLHRKGPPDVVPMISQIASLFGMVLIGVAIFGFDQKTPFPSLFTLVPTIGTVLIILFAGSGTWVKTWLGNRLLVGIGLISYSGYLWHQPLLAFARYRSLHEPNNFLLLILCLVSLVLAYISWRFVEQPFRDRNRIDRRTVIVTSLVVAAMLVGFGMAGKITQGFEHRLSPSQKALHADRELARMARKTGIRAGICHFNGRDGYVNIEQFISNWRCLSNDRGPSDIGVLVFGDSHSADKAVVLKRAGIEITQIGGAGCRLTPSYSSRDPVYCQSLFDLLDRQNKPAAIILANRFRMDELSVKNVRDIFEYWGKYDVPVYLFTPRPNFRPQRKEFALFGSISVLPTFDREEKFLDLLENTRVPDNFNIVKTSQVMCPDRNPTDLCRIHNGDDWLMVDDGHMSVTGARKFARRLNKMKLLDGLR